MKLVAAPRRASSPLCALLVCSLLLSGRAPARQMQVREPQPTSASDLLLVTEGKYADTLFLADAESRAVYFQPLSAGRSRLNFNEFRLFVHPPQFVRPSALGYRNGKLLVGDAGVPALFEVDLETRDVKTVARWGALNSVKAMAVSRDGQLSVAASGESEVFWAEPPFQQAQALTNLNEEDVSRLAIVGLDLLVLNDEGDILSFAMPDPSPSPSPSASPSPSPAEARPHFTRLLLPAGVKNQFKELTDFAHYNGVFYVTDGEKVGVFAQSVAQAKRGLGQSEPVLPLPYARGETPAPSRLAVGDKYLLIGDTKHRTVWLIPRTVPVDVRVESIDPKASEAVGTFYLYLFSRGLLPLAEFESQGEATPTLESLIVGRGILPTPLRGDAILPRFNLSQLLCQLNTQSCSNSPPKGDEFLRRSVAPGTKFLLPDFKLMQYVSLAEVNLDGKTVSARLEETVPADALRARYAIAEKLAAYNEISTEDAKAVSGFMAQTSGRVTLPVLRWRLVALVQAEDLSNPQSPLGRLRLNYPSVRILSKEDTGSKGRSSSLASQPVAVIQELTFETVTRNRALLKKAVSFPDRLPDFSDVRIGVAERIESIDPLHPGFQSAEGGAWLTELPDGVACPVPQFGGGGGNEMEVRPASEFISDREHGTHVAGIIAARAGEPALGLLPGARLYLNDATSEQDLIDSIACAVLDLDIFLFNFSVKFSPVTFDNVRRSMKDDWKTRLFVVAAGNIEPDDPSEVPTFAPAVWIPITPNIIGVGASRLTGDPQTAGVSDKSKVGKRFVHLLAPGEGVFSTTPGNKYKQADGTSQAAPQVTVAAAMLMKNGHDALSAKARLIYTADWFPQLQDKVWGGHLNVRRATWETGRNLLVTQSDTSKLFAVNLADSGFTIKVTRGRRDFIGQNIASTVALLSPAEQIRSAHLLRVWHQGNGRFRLIYLDRGTRQLRIIADATIEGSVRCKTFQEWDADALRFKDPVKCGDDERFKNGLSVLQLFDYVAQSPQDVQFID